MIRLSISNILQSDRFSANIPRWDDLTFPASSLNPSGQQVAATYNPDLVCYTFNATQPQTIGGSVQMPHSWVSGSELRPHLHWGCDTSAPGNVVWFFEYQLREVNDVNPFNFNQWLNSTAIVAAHGAANLHKIAALPPISGSGYSRSAVLIWRLTRNGQDTADTYPGNASLWAFDFHYLINSFGTVNEYGD